MGQFSWLYSDTNKQLVDNKMADTYLLVPPPFQEKYGKAIYESCYDGYGRFGRYDVYDLVADWNREWAKQNPNYTTYRGQKLSDYAWYPFYTDLSLSREEVIEKWKATKDEEPWFDWRIIGIDLSCYDEDNFALGYPIKITTREMEYNCVTPSKSDPNQGWECSDDDDWDEEEDW